MSEFIYGNQYFLLAIRTMVLGPLASYRIDTMLRATDLESTASGSAATYNTAKRI